MTVTATKVAILGSTGSVGRSALEVIAASGASLSAVALTAHHSLALLEAQARAFKPRWIVATDPVAAAQHDWSALPKQTELLVGPGGPAARGRRGGSRYGPVGHRRQRGPAGAWAALEAGKTLALANKESLVVAGPLVTRLAAEKEPAFCPSIANIAPSSRPCRLAGARRSAAWC